MIIGIMLFSCSNGFTTLSMAKLQFTHNLQHNSLLFLHRKTKAPDFLAEAVILTMRIG